MENLNDIFRTFGPEYLVRFGDDIPREHRKVIDAICECRTEEAGIPTSCIAPAVTAIALLVSTVRPDSGSKLSWTDNFPVITS